MNEIFEWIGTNYGGVVLVIVAMVSVLVECLKIPYKKLTAKIKNENHRKLANKLIILFTFGLAYLLEYLASIAIPDTVTYSSLLGFIEGCLSNIVYALGEGLITTTQAKKAASDIKTASSDGKITAEEIKTVKDDVTAKEDKKAASDIKTASSDGKITAEEIKTVKDDVTAKEDNK